MAKGQIALISFPFTHLSGDKVRPVIILAEDKHDVTVCFITSKIGWQEVTDIMIVPTALNGLKKQSLIRTSKIATLDKSLIKGILGSLLDSELLELNNKLIQILKLN